MVVKADSKLIGKVQFETDLTGFMTGGSTVTFFRGRTLLDIPIYLWSIILPVNSWQIF